MVRHTTQASTSQMFCADKRGLLASGYMILHVFWVPRTVYVIPNPHRFKFNKIDEEWNQIETLLLAAREGWWEVVWEILGPPGSPNKIYLINCIPETRRWGVLHQAVYWKNPVILKQLLRYPECDREMKAKVCQSECGETGKMTPREVAESFGYREIARVLVETPIVNLVDESNTFAPYDTAIERQGQGLIAITLSAFKKTFHPGPVDEKKGVDEVLGDIFRSLNSSPTQWQTVRDQVCDALYVVNEVSSNVIKEESTSRDAFYESIINAYTRESTYLYDVVNTVLRRQTEVNYTPLAADLAAGPYIVMYKILLVYWDKLPRESAKTYRNMLLTEDQSKKYQVGKKFTWLGFVSSSVQLEMAVSFPTCDGQGEYSVVFTIDNKTLTSWQPRNIEAFAQYQERERVYPAGARFVVTERVERGDGTYVGLKLID